MFLSDPRKPVSWEHEAIRKQPLKQFTARTSFTYVHTIKETNEKQKPERWTVGKKDLGWLGTEMLPISTGDQKKNKINSRLMDSLKPEGLARDII